MQRKNTKLKRWSIGLILLLIIIPELRGQSKITGKVLSSEEGVELPGATIIINSSSTGTVTDYEGNFSLGVSIGDTLRINYVGFI